MAKVYAAANGLQQEEAAAEIKRKIAETSPAIHGGTEFVVDRSDSTYA
ncbi:unnamed protein product [Trichobilharzia regenti]|nr:unnamed protein product [Trichobilharzia regenti]